MNPVKATQTPIALTSDPILLLLKENAGQSERQGAGQQSVDRVRRPEGQNQRGARQPGRDQKGKGTRVHGQPPFGVTASFATPVPHREPRPPLDRQLYRSPHSFHSREQRAQELRDLCGLRRVCDRGPCFPVGIAVAFNQSR